MTPNDIRALQKNILALNPKVEDLLHYLVCEHFTLYYKVLELMEENRPKGLGDLFAGPNDRCYASSSEWANMHMIEALLTKFYKDLVNDDAKENSEEEKGQES